MNGTAIAVSDGSFFPHSQVGACAWIISSPDGTEWVRGGGIIPGIPADQSAYRSELGGQLGIAAIVSNLIMPTDTNPELIVACDGLSALNKTNEKESDFKVTGKHIDIISITCDLLTKCQFKIKPCHVYGHQDNLHCPLTIMEKLNCQMDTLAKEIAMKYIAQEHRNTSFHSTKLGYGFITYNNTLVTPKIQSTLYTHILYN